MTTDLFAAFAPRRGVSQVGDIAVAIREPSAGDITWATADDAKLFGPRVAVRCIVDGNGRRLLRDEDAARIDAEWAAERLGALTKDILALTKSQGGEDPFVPADGSTSPSASPSLSDSQTPTA